MAQNHLFGENCVHQENSKGEVYLSGSFQGRIFCRLDGEIVHRFDAELAANPSKFYVNNIGGNSFWPAPEGGDYGFNYDASGNWIVQEDINRKQTELDVVNGRLTSWKTAHLRNRHGAELDVEISRQVELIECSCRIPTVSSIGYHSVDEMVFDKGYSTDDVLLNGWSLEQLPGHEGVVAFGVIDGNSRDAINSDFYNNPEPCLTYSYNHFEFDLSSREWMQIGIKQLSQPRLIGALDTKRGFLIVRMTPIRTCGLYVNIADNPQPDGPFSTADMYSIFNGGEMNLYELDTIAPMTIRKGLGVGSKLESWSYIYHGSVPDLCQVLIQEYGIELLTVKPYIV